MLHYAVLFGNTKFLGEVCSARWVGVLAVCSGSWGRSAVHRADWNTSGGPFPSHFQLWTQALKQVGTAGRNLQLSSCNFFPVASHLTWGQLIISTSELCKLPTSYAQAMSVAGKCKKKSRIFFGGWLRSTNLLQALNQLPIVLDRSCTCILFYFTSF